MADAGMIDLVINLVLKVYYPQDVQQSAVVLVCAYFNRNGALFMLSVFLVFIVGGNLKNLSS